MKAAISFSILVFSSIGGWIGQEMDHGNWLGGWSILFSTVGAFIGLWIGYKGGRYFGA
jgi:membrane protein DedA with SNARE-associated domain